MRFGGSTVALLVGLVLVSTSFTWAATTPATASTALSIKITGNHFVNGSGQTIRLLGVNRRAPSTRATKAGDTPRSRSRRPPRRPSRSGTPTRCVCPSTKTAGWASTASPRSELRPVTSRPSKRGSRRSTPRPLRDPRPALDRARRRERRRPAPDARRSLRRILDVGGEHVRADPAVAFDAFNEPYPRRTATLARGELVMLGSSGGLHSPGREPERPHQRQRHLRRRRNADPRERDTCDRRHPTDPARRLELRQRSERAGSCTNPPTPTTSWPPRSTTTTASRATPRPVGTPRSHHRRPGAGRHGRVRPGIRLRRSTDFAPSSSTTFDQTYMNWSDRTGVSYVAWGWWVLGNTTSTCSAWRPRKRQLRFDLELHGHTGRTRRNRAPHTPRRAVRGDAPGRHHRITPRGRG